MRTHRMAPLVTLIALGIGVPEAVSQDPTEEELQLRLTDGTTHPLTARALEVDGERCLPVSDLAEALNGSSKLAPSLSLRGSSLYAVARPAGEPIPGALLGVGRSGRISSRVRGGEGELFPCVPATDVAAALGGHLHEGTISDFDDRIDAVMNDNLLFLALQTKTQNVAQTTQMMSNVAKADSDAKLNAIRNVRVSAFEEGEGVLALLPEDQADWVRSFARGAGRDAGRAEAEAAIETRFGEVPREQMVKIHMILLLVRMGDVVGALRSYSFLTDRDFRSISADLEAELDLAFQARDRIIRNFAAQKPPRAYAGQKPEAARSQDQAQRYTQFVQLSTQLMGELQTSERELVDALQTMRRDLEGLWQAYASLRDEKFRTDERLMRIQ